MTPQDAFDRRHRQIAGCFGRADLDALPSRTLPPQLLADLRDMLNEALRHRRVFDSDAPIGMPYFDYIASEGVNAYASADDTYAFIAVTLPAMTAFFTVCTDLASSVGLVQCLGLAPQTTDQSMLTVVLMRTLLFFVVLHEYTHHVHGHVGDSGVRPEFAYGSGRLDGYTSQPREIDADGYAAYYVLENILNSDERKFLVGVLGLDAASFEEQDNVLFLCFLAVVVGFLFSFEPEDPALNVWEHDHPLAIARLGFFAERCKVWCSQQSRGHLVTLFDQDHRARWVMNVAARTIQQPSQAAIWSDQARYLRSSGGLEYRRTLGSLFSAVVTAR